MFTTNQDALMFTINQKAAHQGTVASTVVQNTSSEVSSVIIYELYKKVSVINISKNLINLKRASSPVTDQSGNYGIYLSTIKSSTMVTNAIV